MIDGKDYLPQERLSLFFLIDKKIKITLLIVNWNAFVNLFIQRPFNLLFFILTYR